MEIFESVIDEIALSGLEGCTIKELWHHLANRKCPNTFPLALDEQAKSYIWSLLLEASSDILNFYVLKNPRQFEEDGLLFTYRLVSNSGIRGSCWDYDTREDVTAAIFNDDTNRNLSQVITGYGEDRLVMVAIQEVRTRTLTSLSMDPTFSVNDVQYCALEAVGRARDKGILRSHLTNKYLKIDPRSTFHHVGILQSIGAIVIKGYSKGYQLFLTRFSAYANQLDNEVTLSDKVCNMLLETPDHCLPETEIIEEFNSAKEYRRIRSKLVNKGLAEIVKSADGETRLLKLIKPARQAATVNPEGLDLDDTNEQQENGCSTLPKHFVVAERLFEMQGYKILDSAGPGGMTLSEFNQAVQGVDNNTKRTTLANLSKQGCIVSILIDDYKVKKYRYISNNQADKSSDISKLKSEAKKSSHAFTLAIRSKNASLIDQTSTTSTTIPPASLTTTTLSAASPSLETTMTSVASTSTEDVANGSIMDDDAEVEGILKDAGQNVEAKVRVCSPATMASDFHKRHNVKGIPLRKMERINFILECIETEKVILSKSLLYKKVLEFETQKGFTTRIDRKTLSKLLQSLVDKGMVNVKTIQLAPSTKPEHSIYHHSSVTEAQMAEAISEAQDLFTVKETTIKKRKAQKCKTAEENSDEITIPEALTDFKDDAYVLIPVTSKFQRLHHLHLYLWILQYGLPDDSILSSVTFPWISAVSKVDNINDVIRWRTINDNMPLSLLVIIVGVHQQQMPRKLYDFIQRPEIRNLSLKQLPKHIQLYINAKRRDVVRLYELLVMLEEMKLAVIHQPTGHLIKINVEVELLRSCSVLDTSQIKTRHSFFLEESRSQFNSITFQFDSLKDLQAYWFKLKSVCMMTKIFKPRGDEPPDDEYALYMSKYRKVPEDYNKLGFGAGGLVPLLYSHILYNWGTMTFFKSEQELQDSAADNKPILPEVTYTDLPIVPPDEARVHCQYSGRCKRKLSTLEGGNATISAAKRVKRAASHKVHKKKANLSTKVKRTNQNKLVAWSNSEDGVLMRCHVALCVLNAHSLPIPTPVEMCEIIRDWIIPHRFKHAITTQKHMNNICSRDSAVRDQLKNCVDELLQTIEMGGGPPLNFKSLLHYLIDNYTGCVPVFSVAVSTPTTPPTVSLPTTLQLLKQSCEVCAPHETGLLLPPVHTVADVRKSMLVDLIIVSVVLSRAVHKQQLNLFCDDTLSMSYCSQKAVMGAGSECYSEYTAFHLFEEYLEQELEDVLSLLRSAALVKQRKAVDGISGKHLGPSATQTLMLHTNFYSRLESNFPCHLFEDIYTYSTNLGLASTESTPKEEDCMPSGGEVATKLNSLASSAYFCSSATDSFMSNLASLDVELFSCYFVGKQSLPDVPQLDDEDDDCEDDDKESTGDDRKITAFLPYRILIPLSNNRNFSNLTFKHGYSVGSLLACDSCPSDGLTQVQRMTDNSADNMEHGEELSRECVLDSAGPAVVCNKADDSMEHSMEHDMECDMEHGMEYGMEHDIQHTLDNAGPTVEHAQRHTTDSQGRTEDVGSHTNCDSQLSIDEYLELCVKHLNYSEYDVIFAKYLYDIIYHAGVMGVSQLNLEQLHQIGITMTTVEHIQQLKNFEMVIEVGVQVVRLVAAEHKRVWLLDMKKQHSSDDQQFTKCRPWTSLHGQEFTGMYQKMQDAVLFYIMDYPGVTLYALQRKFTGMIQLNSLRDILEVLIAGGCISCHRMIRQRSCDLFSSSQTIVAPSSLYDDIPSNIYFEPLIGCELVYSHSLQPSSDVTT